MTDVNSWVYAIMPAGHPVPAGAGVADEDPRAVTAAGLVAVTGRVPRADFDEEPLRARLEDPAWLERTVRAHHRVVESLERTAPVLPMRFATLYRDDRRVAALLRARAAEFRELLRHVAGCQEWGVKGYATAPPAEPAGAPGRQPAAGGRPGTAYLLRRREQRRSGAEQGEQALRDADEVHRELLGTRTVVDVAGHPLHGSGASGRREPMVLNVACLVARESADAFHRTLAALAARHPSVALEVTGPWPPYSFTATATATTDGAPDGTADAAGEKPAGEEPGGAP